MDVLNFGEIVNLLLVLSIAASVAGFMAGLLGVGGGIIMGPALYYAFTVLDFDIATRMHISVGTSLAIIVPTSIISAKTHMEHKAVDVNLVKSFGIFIVLGVIGGTFLAINLRTSDFILFFSIMAFIVGLFFIFFRDKFLENPKKIKDSIKNISGVAVGLISVLLGIGGGSLMVPFMRTFGYDIRKSIGTASAIGILIAISGTITMITGGEIINNISTPYTIGYINLFGFIVFVPVTMLMARIGAKAVYKIDKKLLSKIFGSFLIIVSIRSFIEYLKIS